MASRYNKLIREIQEEHDYIYVHRFDTINREFDRISQNKSCLNIIMEKKFKLGLVGSSQIEKYPLDLLEDQNLVPIMLSSSPKNAKDIVNSGRLDEIIESTIKQHHDMDAVFIFVGGNDVKKHAEVRDIAMNILEIAERFNDIGIEPIIIPLINRENPSGILVPKYTKIRNSINRFIRKFYQKNNKKYNVINLDNLDLKTDGVHLRRSSYREISRAIKIKMNILTTSGCCCYC